MICLLQYIIAGCWARRRRLHHTMSRVVTMYSSAAASARGARGRAARSTMGAPKQAFFGLLLLLLSLAAAVVEAVPITSRLTGCFGGALYDPSDHIALYGHSAGVEGCGPGSPNHYAQQQQQHSSSGELALNTRGIGQVEARQVWHGNETAMVIIDMWSYHPCKTVTNRAGALVPRLNAVASAVRAAGGLVIFAPSDAAEAYVGWPQRERVFATPHVRVPPFLNISFPALKVELTGRDDECSDAGHGCVWNYGEARQNPAMIISSSDYIVGGDVNPVRSACSPLCSSSLFPPGPVNL
jgi:hypothetical protein